MDMKKIEKARPVIASIIVLTILGFIFIPKLFRKSSGITASGTVEVTEVDVASRVNARVTKILADEGKNVAKDDVLAELDDSVVAAQKEAAGIAFSNATKNYERSRNLFKTGSISDVTFEQAQSAYIAAKAAYAQAKTLYEDATIKAPWDGFILERHVEVGELVSPNAPIFTIGDLKTAKVTIYIPLPDLGRIKLGEKAEVSSDSFANKQYEGEITKIAGEAEFTPKNVQTKDERVKEVFAVEITVPNESQELKPGMPVDVEINIKK